MDEDEVASAATETRAIPLVTRDLQIRADTFDEADNSVEVCFTTGMRGARFDWRRWEMIDEELSTESAHVRLDRINSGGPVLNSHNQWELEDQIGVVVDGSARMEGGEGIARLRFSRRESIAPIIQDIRDRVIRNISVGYRVHEYEITERDGERPLYRAVDWEPYEISFVPVPFDNGAQSRSASERGEQTRQGGHPCILRRAVPAISTQERNMDEDEVQTGGESAGNDTNAGTSGQQQRGQEQSSQQSQQQTATVNGAAVRTAATNAGLDAAATMELLERHADAPFTRDALMADIGRRFAERDSNVRTANRVPASAGNGVTMARAMGDALFHRMSPGSELSADARNFRGMSLLRMAEEYLGSSGISMRGMTAHEIAERALHSTSDFPALMGNAMNRRLRAAYEENQPSYRRWARRAPNAPDFRSIDVIQTSAMPDLLKVNEAGEFKYGTVSDGKVSYAVVTYGRIIGISRQTLINDDLRALERMTTGFAGSAARLENRTVYSQLTANPTMSYDTTALFHADHGNLAGAGGPISATTLGAGRTAMRLQKGLQKEELNLAPRWLIVPATQEQLAYQYTSSQYVPAKQSDTNEFRSGGRTAVEPIVESVLDGASTTAWYMAAGNEQCDTIEYTYLEGAEGVQLSSRIGFTVDGVELKASLDFAAATIDHRGLYKNAG